MRKLTSLFMMASCALLGQVGGPALGWVPDSGSVRALFGIPAAGAVGNVLDSGLTLSLIEVSPTQSFALAKSADNGQVLVLTPSSDGTATLSSPLSGAGSAPSQILFAPDGNTAALWFSAAKHAQVVTGLPNSPSIRDVDASSFAGDPAALAVSDDGQWLVGAWAQGVYALGASGQPILLPADGPAQAVCFFHGKSSVAILTQNQLTTVTDIGGQVTPAVVWSKPPGAPPNDQAAVGLALSSDDTRLTVVGNLGGIATFDLALNTNSYVLCNCTPSALAGMGGALYRLTGVDQNTVKLYDAATASVWSVPLQATPRIRRIMRGAASEVESTEINGGDLSK